MARSCCNVRRSSKAFSHNPPLSEPLERRTLLSAAIVDRADFTNVGDQGSSPYGGLTVDTNAIKSLSLDSSAIVDGNPAITDGNSANLTVNLAFPAVGAQNIYVTSSVPSLIPSFSGAVTNSTSGSIPVVANFTACVQGFDVVAVASVSGVYAACDQSV